jgi:plastocyanin
MKRIGTFAAVVVVLIVVGCAPVAPHRDASPPPVETAPAATPTPPIPTRTASTPAAVSVPAPTAPAPVAASPLPVRVVAKVKPASKPQAPRPATAPAVAAVAQAPVSKGSAARAELRGLIVLDAGTGQGIEPGDIEDSVVYFVPSSGSASVKPGSFTIYTRNKHFDPALLVIPVGSTVKFPNQDEILHNVFSTTSGSSFDLGVYGGGESGEYTFRKPGLVLVHCNVHESMLANILVLNTPYFARPAKDGSFSIPDAAAGPGTLMLWHPRAARPAQLAVNLPATDAPVIHIAIVKARVPLHLNKEGKAYRHDAKTSGTP